MRLLRLTNQVLGRVAPGAVGERARQIFMRPRPGRASSLPEAERLVLASGLVAWRRSPRVAPKGRVLALHGWESRAAHLRGLIGPLVDAGAEVVALDAPAHGDSPGREAHPVAFAQALHAAAAALGPFDAAFGHSMGGGALLLALAEGLPVARAAVLGAPSSIDGVLHRFAGFIGLPGRAERAFVETVERTVGRRPAEVSASVLAPRVHQPVLVVHDENDLEVPFSDAEELVRVLSSASLVATRGLGHRRLLKDAAVAQAIVHFFIDGAGSRRHDSDEQGVPLAPSEPKAEPLPPRPETLG
ncbi:MAG: alpha/beta fold hydrolase [Myxococcaceae bacterium]|nr:alpha/beta fold hydrolase [Myxococcaceae bacterium]